MAARTDSGICVDDDLLLPQLAILVDLHTVHLRHNTGVSFFLRLRSGGEWIEAN